MTDNKDKEEYIEQEEPQIKQKEPKEEYPLKKTYCKAAG